jgi:putative restriction endonuclease
VTEYLDFDRLVPYTENGGDEKRLVRPDGSINGGYAVQAVRVIESDEFTAIVEAGLSAPDDWPDRTDQSEDATMAVGFEDEPQTEFNRPIIQQLLNRPFRDAKFRQHIRKAYDRTCAFTGLRLINGKGRPEVEAAHIMPVEVNGPDSIRNGIALSATVHWMFDRGLLSLADDFSILKSRHLNHDISHLLLPNMMALVPSEPSLQPHPYFLNWHRTNCFKT